MRQHPQDQTIALHDKNVRLAEVLLEFQAKIFS
jgi:hypothetical protein